MVAKCANPECNRQFRQLSKGRLFLLPPSDEMMWRVERLTDYCYWLCPSCSQTHTVLRHGPELIVSKQEHPKGSPRPNAA